MAKDRARPGFPLAWDKASLADRFLWIGAQLSVEDFGISVDSDPGALHTRFLSATVAQKKYICSFCGKLSFVAGMVPTLRPFDDMVSAALASSSQLPLEFVHCRRFWVARWWLKALHSEVPGPLVRVFLVAPESNYTGADACLWGFASVLFDSFKPVASHSRRTTFAS